VAHNLRAPSTSISSLVGMLEETKNYEEAKQFFPKLSKITSILNVLVDDLLMYVRLLNNEEVKIESINLTNIIKNTLDLFKEILDSKTIDIKYDLSGWNHVEFSKIYMQSILQNLISNAIKFRDVKKKSYIYISTKLVFEKKTLIISDNGLGINLDRHNKDIFRLYKRFHRNISGKGLGLFLVKTQLESLGARIEVKSEIDKGTDFILTFD
jgi:signal transduction histidine kinase